MKKAARMGIIDFIRISIGRILMKKLFPIALHFNQPFISIVEIDKHRESWNVCGDRGQTEKKRKNDIKELKKERKDKAPKQLVNLELD